MTTVSDSPPRPPPVKYHALHGTRWQKEKAAATKGEFEYPDDPQLIGPWIIGECVGKGASGRVKIAKHRKTGQLAAVKILPLQPLVNSRASLATQQARSDKQRFGIDREITMMKLMNHPNIIRIYDVYEGDDELYLILEYVEGGELFDFLVNRGKLSSLEALAVFKQIIYGLNYAHAFSIIHRDLKPENILIHSLYPPLIKIADWGMAAFAPPSLQLETSCGSPHYASPEIVNGGKYEGNATDVWSCGVILFALLTGRLPFDDKNVRVLLSKVKVGKFEMPRNIDPLAKDLIARMLVVDVSQRMTIPEILAHVWLQNSTPGIIYVPAPPVSELARPLRSAAHIDRNLLESLRIIWGRHADLDTIKSDLLSPAGEGTLAKAFYFLLHQHREITLQERGLIMDLDSTSPRSVGNKPKVITKQYTTPHSIFRHSNQLTVGIKPPGLFRSNRNAPAPPLRFPSPLPIHNLSLNPPVVKTNSRPRAPSPCGPRPPRPRPKSTPISCPPTNELHLYTDSDYGYPVVESNVRSSKMSRSPSPSQFSSPRPESRLEYQVMRAPSRTQRPTYTAQASLVESPHGLSPVKFPVTSSPQPSSPIMIGHRRNTMSPNYQPDHIHSPAPISLARPLEPIPMLTAPRTNNPLVQRTIDDITERVNILVARGNNVQFFDPSGNTTDTISAQIPDQWQNQSRLPRMIGSHLPTATAVPSHVLGDHRRDRAYSANKENMIEDAAYHTIVDLQQKENGANVTKPHLTPIVASKEPLSNVLTMDNGIVGQRRARERKERNPRPTPLNVQPPLNTKRSTLSNISSPTLASPSLLSPVGEFKGWFSNLFNWKAQSYVLYSNDNLSATRNETARLLHRFGVNMALEDVEGIPVLRCRIDEGMDIVTGLVVQKRTTFRVEFITSSSETQKGARQYAGLSSPRNSHDGFSPNMNSARTGVLQGKNAMKMPGYQCAIVLIQEKGSMSTFRGLSRRLKEEWRLGIGLQSPGTRDERTTQLVERMS